MLFILQESRSEFLYSRDLDLTKLIFRQKYLESNYQHLKKYQSINY